MDMPLRLLMMTGAFALLAGCATAPAPTGNAAGSGASVPAGRFQPLRVTTHRDGDDLLTAGLGLDGLRGPPPAFADPAAPTPAELRRRAIWSNWRGIADLVPGGGFGELYGTTAAVPGREYHAYAWVPGARHPHRVVVQVPDRFDRQSPCLVVAPASGSRGVYGAIAVAGPWALPRGCAVAYTDKGAGTDYFDLQAGVGVRPDGTVGAIGESLAFVPEPAAGQGIAVKHAHSRDNPEADWGRHVEQAAEFALDALGQAFPRMASLGFDDTTVIAVGISNGGGAVLRAAERPGDRLDAVVAGAPNVHVAGSRALYDYTTEAALLMPCALVHLGVAATAGAAAECGALADAGLVSGVTAAQRQASAYETLRAAGWTDEALHAGAISVAFDVWRTVAITYASAYGRHAAGEHPCGHRFSALTTEGAPRPATASERAGWWAEGSGIPPGAGVGIVAPPAGPDPLAERQCLRRLWAGGESDSQRLREGVAETVAGAPRAGLPVIVIHGQADGLVPPAFSSAPYVEAAEAEGRDLRYWQVPHVQHFDAFLGMPAYAARYLPLLPYVYEALDRTWAHLHDGAPLPDDAVPGTSPRGPDTVLQPGHLAVPR